MPTPANSINEATTGVVGFTSTAFTATPVTQFDVLVGGSTSSTISSVGPGSAGQVLQSGGNAANPVYSTATYPATATGTGTILRADGTNWSATTSTYPNTNAVSTLLYASSANVMSALATANNGVLITSASGVPSLLANGTTGQVLTATTGAPPAWAPTIGNNLVLIQSQPLSAVANASFTTGITTTYNTYLFVISNLLPASNGVVLRCQVSVDGGLNYLATGYLAGHTDFVYNSTTLTNANSTTLFPFTGGQINTGGIGISGNVYFYNIKTANPPQMNAQLQWNNGSPVSSTAIGTQSTTSGVNAFQWTFTTGNITSGTITLFGILE